ncbi:hypothetical protein N0V88_006610 [Collariella sp. IMI 366227]|nr:hypothetical protein N0V88_006610 [Collariella sp. IMI 366227]
MLSKFFLLAITLTPLVSAHGKVTVVTGNAGGNGTALGIRGGVVPGADTTIFPSTTLLANGLGRTKGSGPNVIAMIVDAMALSGITLPQITAGGNITGPTTS